MKRSEVFSMTNGRCFYCGCKLEFESFHVDHFLPKSKGGKLANNSVPACPQCNLAKSNLSVEEFRSKIKRYWETFPGVMIGKYYKIEDSDIVFYFEKITGE